jgi:allantoinase
MTVVVRSRRVVTPDGEEPADIVVDGGRIAELARHGSTRTGEVVDFGRLVVSPGLVDSHVHFNQPGRTHWEGFETGTAAALAGGTTTVVDMPLNSVPPTCDPAALDAKRREASGLLRTDVAFWGGIVPGSIGHVETLARTGVRGFKVFLVDSGVPEFPPLDETGLREALEAASAVGLPVLVHAELPGPMAAAQERFALSPPEERRRYATYLASRPAGAEDEAVALVVRLAEETGARVHVLHLASGSAAEQVGRARRRGVAITAETCPHYLMFAAEEIPDGATLFKCAPPIREAEHRRALWEALEDGSIDMVVSDHSPSPPELKAVDDGDFARAWGGISSVQLRLASTWTAARPRGWTVVDLARVLSDAPARLAGLAGKGRVAPGYDADLVVWDPDAEFRVDPGTLRHRHPVSPYAGRVLTGRVIAVFLRGVGATPDGPVSGRAL